MLPSVPTGSPLRIPAAPIPMRSLTAARLPLRRGYALAAKPGKGKGAYDDFADYDYTEEDADDTFSDLKMINSIADDVTYSRAIGLITLRRNSNA